MSDSYTKLFSSITESTVWSVPAGTRLVWITMLALVRRDGVVYASLPGLADRAKVTLKETITALEALSSPDPYSRTKAHEGRRIEEIDGGWLLLNHGKYAKMRSTEERKEYMRNLMAEKRLAEKLAKVSKVSPTSTNTSTNTISKEEEQKREKRSPKNGSRLPPDFPDNSSIAWAQKERQDMSCHSITTEVAQFRDYWLGKAGKDGRKADWPATWRNWIRRSSNWTNASSKSSAPQSKTMQSMEVLERIKNNARLDNGGISNGPAETPLLESRGPTVA